MTETISQPPDMPYTEHLNQPIDIDEIRQAVLTGKRQKAPVSDGLGRDFHKVHWTTIKKNNLHTVLNHMYSNKTIMPQQKHGVTGRKRRPTTGRSHCSTMTLNSARILARRLRPLLGDDLWRSGQHNPRRCCDRAGRHRAIRDDAHPSVHAVIGFSRSIRQSFTSLPVHHSQILWPT